MGWWRCRSLVNSLLHRRLRFLLEARKRRFSVEAWGKSDAAVPGYGGMERNTRQASSAKISESDERIFNAPVLRNGSSNSGTFRRQTAEVELNARGWFYSTDDEFVQRQQLSEVPPILLWCREENWLSGVSRWCEFRCDDVPSGCVLLESVAAARAVWNQVSTSWNSLGWLALRLRI